MVKDIKDYILESNFSMNHFGKIPKDMDTKYLFRKITKLVGDIHVVIEKWKYSGSTGISLIFSTKDVGNPDEAIQILKESKMYNEYLQYCSEMTISTKSSGFIFFNWILDSN